MGGGGGVVTAVAPLKSGFLILEMSCERLIKEETFMDKRLCGRCGSEITVAITTWVKEGSLCKYDVSTIMVETREKVFTGRIWRFCRPLLVGLQPDPL